MKDVKQMCKFSGKEFIVRREDRRLLDALSPRFAGKKYLITHPTLSPWERMRRRLAWRNERNLYRRICDATGKPMISMYQDTYPWKVYNKEYRRTDQRDALDYGRNYDFDKPFFEQYQRLLHDTPLLNLLNIVGENSDYVNCASRNKNCYLCFDIGECEDCLYCKTMYHSHDCIDCSFTTYSENSWRCVDSYKLFQCKYCISCYASTHCSFCYDCRGCHDCFMCSNMTNASYCFMNQPLTKEIYQRKIMKYKILTHDDGEKLKNAFSDMLQTSTPTESFTQCDNCSWWYQKNCKNTYESFGTVWCEDSAYMLDSVNVNNSLDDCYAGIVKSEWNYESIGSEDPQHCCFIYACWAWCSNLLYCSYCISCKNCFACVALRNKEYCIFNKQYTLEEYEVLVPRIIAHMQKTQSWWEYFPISISPFGYNETVAHDYFPVRKEDALRDHWHWSDTEVKINIPENADIVRAENLPDTSLELGKDILGKVIVCENSGKPYRIMALELSLYKKWWIPLPRIHHDIRHQERLKYRQVSFK